MLKKRVPAIALVAVFLVAVFGLSFSPVQSPNSNTIEKAKYHSQKIATDVTIPENSEDRIADYTWWLSAFTLALVIVSGLQIFFLTRADETARTSADAAKLSADAAVATERARFYVIIDSCNLPGLIAPAIRSNSKANITYYFKNYGKTPGIIKEVTHGIYIAPAPRDPVYSLSVGSIDENMIAEGGNTNIQILTDSVPLETIADAIPIATGEVFFWFYGRLEYEDVYGNSHTHRFFMRYVKLGGNWRFQPYDYKHYNTST